MSFKANWICKVIVVDYDDDWGFRSKNTRDRIEEGSTVTYYGSTALDAFTAFTNDYSVEGYHKVFGDHVPTVYSHVINIRKEIDNYSNELKSEHKNLNISGNYNVNILLNVDKSLTK